MPKKSKEKQKHKWDERSTQRTAEFIVGRLEIIQEDIGDLIAEFRALEKFDHIITAACTVRDLEGLRKTYKKMADGHTWEEDD
jgi:hypothetical protein